MIYPQLKGINRDYPEWKYLQEAIERAVGREGNKDMIGLGSKVLFNRNVPAALLDKILGIPTVKARLAFALKSAATIEKSKIQTMGQMAPAAIIPSGGKR
jgi:hypothetical protein